VYLHRLLMNAVQTQQVDHANGNSLDNRRENLRFCTSSQNSQNRRRTSTSGFKGVSLKPRYKSKPWEANIKVAGKLKYLGRFQTPEEAAKAYDSAARDMFGEFAHTNFPI
jgi:hypothetical protein